MTDILPTLTHSLELAMAHSPYQSPENTLRIAKTFHKYLTADPVLHARLDGDTRRAALEGIVRECLDGYEFRADVGDYTPNGLERLLLEDFGESLLAMIEERLGIC